MIENFPKLKTEKSFFLICLLTKVKKKASLKNYLEIDWNKKDKTMVKLNI